MNEVTQAHQAYYRAGWWRDQTFLDDLDRHATRAARQDSGGRTQLATGRTTRSTTRNWPG